jgi:hypothetical protein
LGMAYLARRTKKCAILPEIRQFICFELV